MGNNERRVTFNTKPNSYEVADMPTGVLPLDPTSKNATYFQIKLGEYGVVLPKTINVDNLEGLTLVKGKATAIHDQKLARKIAAAMEGTLLQVTESYSRIVENLSLPPEMEPAPAFEEDIL